MERALEHRSAFSTRRWLMASFALALVFTTSQGSMALPGGLDPTFGGDGKITTNFSGAADYATAVAIQDDGKIVVAGGSAFPNSAFALARYNTDGTLDISFGGDGRVVTNLTPKGDAAWGVVIQDDQRIVAAGDAGLGTSNSRFAVATTPMGLWIPVLRATGP